jgi:hypothetical protein
VRARSSAAGTLFGVVNLACIMRVYLRGHRASWH